MAGVGGDDRVEDLRVGARVVVGGEVVDAGASSLTGGAAAACRSSATPESEQRKAIASAMSSTGVKVGYSLSGFSSRILGVRIALTTRMLAVAPVPGERVGEGEGPGLGRGLGAA